MSQININEDKLAEKIAELEALKSNCSGHSSWRKRETKYGSGEVADLLDNIDQEYVSLMSDFDTLIGNSISFFNNILNSVISADSNAKKNF